MKATLYVLIDPQRGSSSTAIARALKRAGVSYQDWLWQRVKVRVLIVPPRSTKSSRRSSRRNK